MGGKLTGGYQDIYGMKAGGEPGAQACETAILFLNHTRCHPALYISLYSSARKGQKWS